MDRVTWKISVAGIKSSGKTSLISRIVYDTDGTGGPAKAIFRKHMNLEYRENKVIADLLFQEINDDTEAEKLLPSSNLIIVVADIFGRNGLAYASDLIKYAKNFERKPPIILVATKTDLRYEAVIWTAEFEEAASKLNVPYFMVSAKTGDSVEKLLEHVVGTMLERFYAKRQSAT